MKRRSERLLVAGKINLASKRGRQNALEKEMAWEMT
jgi:hypothetical protein